MILLVGEAEQTVPASGAQVNTGKVESFTCFMDLSVGTRLGPYEILAPLGAGGMGQVYKACDTRLGRTVAVKVLEAHLALDPVFRKRFEREARSISSLNHPHICVLHDVGRQDDIEYLVMEYLEGVTLLTR